MAVPSFPEVGTHAMHPAQDSTTHGRFEHDHAMQGTTPDDTTQNVGLAKDSLNASEEVLGKEAPSAEASSVTEGLAQNGITISVDPTSGKYSFNAAGLGAGGWKTIYKAQRYIDQQISANVASTGDPSH